MNSTTKIKAVKYVEEIIFNIRWVLPLFYLGLVAMLLMYGYAFAREVGGLLSDFNKFDIESLRVVMLDMVDVVMIANLIKMIITGSYNSFISKSHGRANEQISSGMLKVKIATSVVIVFTIHLLRAGVQDLGTLEDVFRQLMYFAAFLVAALVLSITEYLHIKGEAIETNIELQKEEHEQREKDHNHPN